MRFDIGGKRVWVTGHRGTVCVDLVRRFGREDCIFLTVDRKAVHPLPGKKRS